MEWVYILHIYNSDEIIKIDSKVARLLITIVSNTDFGQI